MKLSGTVLAPAEERSGDKNGKAWAVKSVRVLAEGTGQVCEISAFRGDDGQYPKGASALDGFKPGQSIKDAPVRVRRVFAGIAQCELAV